LAPGLQCTAVIAALRGAQQRQRAGTALMVMGGMHGAAWRPGAREAGAGGT